MQIPFVSSLLLATPLIAQQFPEVEPNDTPATAQVVALGSQINSNLTAGEQDWYQFTTPGGYHRISTAGPDTQLEVWDSLGTTALAFNDDGQGTNSSIFTNFPAGTYLVKIDGFSASTSGTYTIDFSLVGSKPLNGAEVEPNDTIATATPVADGAQLGASLSAPVSVLADVVAAGSTTTVVNTTATLVAGQFDDGRYWLRCTSGANAGLSRRITTTAANALTVATGFPAAPAAGDTYEVDQYDSDYYRVDVTAPRAEVVFSITEGDLPWVRGWSYEVRDAAGALINSTFLGTNVADSSSFNARVTSFRVWPTGTYYVRVFQRRSELTGAPTVAPAFANYRFELKVKDMNTLGTVAETEPAGGPQSNNTAFTATPISPGQVGTGNITNSTGADPSDWWGPISIPSQSLITFQVSMGGAPGLADATINLRQVLDPVTGTVSAGTAVTGGNILEAGSTNPRGVFNFLLPGTEYYLEVVSPGTAANQAGNYELEISIVDDPTYAAGNWASATANASGCGTAGVPTIARVLSSELPVIGQTLVQRVTNLNAAANLGLMLIGTSGLLGPSGAPAGSPASIYNPQPVDITSIGAPGCTVNVNPFVIDVLVGDPSGVADYVVTCPASATLAGAVLFFQPCKWDFATPINPIGIQPGNWSRVIFGTRTF